MSIVDPPQFSEVYFSLSTGLLWIGVVSPLRLEGVVGGIRHSLAGDEVDKWLRLHSKVLFKFGQSISQPKPGSSALGEGEDPLAFGFESI